MMNKKEREEQRLLMGRAKQGLQQIRNAQKHNKGKVNSEYIDWIDGWELTLRDIMQQKGMLMPKADDPKYAISKGQY